VTVPPFKISERNDPLRVPVANEPPDTVIDEYGLASKAPASLTLVPEPIDSCVELLTRVIAFVENCDEPERDINPDSESEFEFAVSVVAVKISPEPVAMIITSVPEIGMKFALQLFGFAQSPEITIQFSVVFGIYAPQNTYNLTDYL